MQLNLLLIFSIALGCGAGTLLAAESARRPDRLLTAGEKNTPAAVEIARQTYEQLKHAAADDSRLDYAYALVLINQARYRSAAGLIENYLRTNPNDLAAMRVMLHAQILDRRYAAATRSGEALAARIERPKSADRPEELAAGAELLGTMFGYLELRGSAAMSPEQVSASKNRVLKKIHGSTLSAFDQGRQVALSLYQQADADRETKLQKQQIEVEEVRSQAQARLAVTRDKSGETRQSAQESGEQLREWQREYDVLAQQLLTFTRDRIQIGTQITGVQAEIVAMSQTQDPGILDLRDPISRGPDRATRVTTTDPLRAVQISALANALASLNRQALELDRRILALQTRAGELVAAGAKASEELAESTAALAKSEKRAKNLEKQLARAERKAATKAAAAKAPAVTGRMAQFSTYAPFPYEQEKERVLSWYAK